MLSFNRERLAIGFALITSVGTRDCHYAIKLISKMVRREIVVRDSNRFRHFKSGGCYFRDYW